MAQATGAPSPAAAPSADDIKQRAQELEAVRAQQKSAAEVQERLKTDIAAIGQNRSKLNQQLIDVAAGVRAIETKIAETEARLLPLDAREQNIRGSLDFAALGNRGSACRPATCRPPRPARVTCTAGGCAAIAAHCDVARLRGTGDTRARGKACG